VTSLATASELASYLQQDLDTSTAVLVLSVASAELEAAADTKFSSTAATYTVEGVGQRYISLPHYPIIAVQSVTVDGVATTDYTRIASTLYRIVGFGGVSAYAAAVVVTYTYGYTAVPDDVKGAVLEMAAQAYANPERAVREQVDDYVVQRVPTAGGVGLTSYAATVAARYRIGAVA
jgi:hypothetical protein